MVRIRLVPALLALTALSTACTGTQPPLDPAALPMPTPTLTPSPRPTATPITKKGFGVCHSTSATGCVGNTGLIHTPITIRITAVPAHPVQGELVHITMDASDPYTTLEPLDVSCPVIQGIPGEKECGDSSSSCDLPSLSAAPAPSPHHYHYTADARFDSVGSYPITSNWKTSDCPEYYEGLAFGHLQIEVSAATQ